MTDHLLWYKNVGNGIWNGTREVSNALMIAIFLVLIGDFSIIPDAVQRVIAAIAAILLVRSIFVDRKKVVNGTKHSTNNES